MIETHATQAPRRLILSLGVTPALQRILRFEKFTLHGVNRAYAVHQSAAGKSVNVGMALAALGHEAWVTGFNGGETGRCVLEDMQRRGAKACLTPLGTPTRICTTILEDGGRETELVEETSVPPPEAIERFVASALCRLDACDALAISGTLPPFLDDEFYLPFARQAQRHRMPWVIDSHRRPLLAVLSRRPLVAKMNRSELAATFDQPCERPGEVLHLAGEILAMGAQWVLITDGPRPGYLVNGTRDAWRLLPPELPGVVNPIGSGDSVTAGMLHACLAGQSMPDAACFGLCCGSANAATLVPASFDPALAKRMRAQCRAERIETLASA